MSVPVGQALRELLLADAGVVALVVDRVGPAPLRGPEEPVPTLPAITYQRMGSTRPRHFSGRSHPTATRMQVDCWALNHDTAEIVFDAVRLALDMMASAAHDIQLMEIVDGSDQFLPEPEVKLARFTADYMINHAEAVA